MPASDPVTQSSAAESDLSVVTLLFANVTSWSALARGFAARARAFCDGFFLAEHHLIGDKLKMFKNDGSQMRRQPHIQPAYPSPGGDPWWCCGSCEPWPLFSALSFPGQKRSGYRLWD
eukprot:4579080-Pyramimonas_sp.AAC.1